MDSDDGVGKPGRIANTRRSDLVLPDLSYRIVGCLFEVSNAIGTGHRESVFQKAIAEALKGCGIKFKEQVVIPLKFHGKEVGSYRIDFLIDDTIVLEIKQGERFKSTNLKQTLAYLKSSGKPLAILANFTLDGVVFKRLVNKDVLKAEKKSK
jgi:GxxExxY protein